MLLGLFIYFFQIGIKPGEIVLCEIKSIIFDAEFIRCCIIVSVVYIVCQ